MKKKLLAVIIFLSGITTVRAQEGKDTTVKIQRFNFHFQQTIITQDKPGFNAKYSGANSLSTKSEAQTSLTTTFFTGARLWKGAAIYFNPEMSGGAGLSKTLGIAGFPNGETFRVGSAEPKIYIARLYLNQNFTWGNDRDTITDDANLLGGFKSKRYFSVTLGKFGMSDYFDANSYSHDPRSQFMNWSLMSNGAWDYPANTRGYVIGVFTEFGQPTWTLRFATTMNVTEANSSLWDAKVGKANTETLEFEKRYALQGQRGAFRVLGFLNNGKMGDYNLAVAQNPAAPDVISTRQYGRHKYGIAANTEQSLTPDLGVFAKLSYNDGHNETWFFTEIDRSVSFGGILKGRSWKRKYDELGLAFIDNGISKPHRDYLAAGGYGFLIGDGQINYGHELIAEFYYKIDAFQEKFFISPDYQFIVNPAYNKDRGPVSVFGVRAHVQF